MDRGEIPTRTLPAKVVSVAVDLARHQLLMTLKPLSREAIVDIVDGYSCPS
jgi:hypothetical protein